MLLEASLKWIVLFDILKLISNLVPAKLNHKGQNNI